MSDYWHILNTSQDIISFGSQRIPARNVASISIVEDPNYATQLDLHNAWQAGVGFAIVIGIGIAGMGLYVVQDIVQYNASHKALYDIQKDVSGGAFVAVVGAFVAVVAWLIMKYAIGKGPTKYYEIHLLTNGGSITALKGLSWDFAEKVLAVLQNAVSGHDHRPIYIDASKQEIKVDSVDMSQKTYSAENSPGAVVGDNTNATVSTNVTIQGVQDVDKLMARVGEIAGEDRAKLLKLLIEMRSYLADGSVSKEKAKASYTEFLAGIGKYFSTASDIVSLVSGIARFF